MGRVVVAMGADVDGESFGRFGVVVEGWNDELAQARRGVDDAAADAVAIICAWRGRAAAEPPIEIHFFAGGIQLEDEVVPFDDGGDGGCEGCRAAGARAGNV